MHTDDADATALREAVAADDLQAVAEMLAKGVSVDAPLNYVEGRPLHLAAGRGYLDMVELLIARGCEVNTQTLCPHIVHDDPRTKGPLARHPRFRLVFINNKESNLGVTPLHIAVKRNHLPVVKALISANANVNAEDKMKETPLFSAVAYDLEKVAAFLLEKGAAVSARNVVGSTPLHWAAEFGNIKLTNLLVRNNAAVNAKNSQGFTPLHLSVLNGQAAVSQFLIDSGADVNATDNEGRTPLHTGARSGCAPETARLLIAKGASVNARDKCGRTPLHLAAERDYADIVNILINNNADVNVTDDLMWTPLHCAAVKGNVDIVISLYLLKAKIDARTHEQATPLHLAADRCHADVVNSLLSLGAEVNAADHTNWTALHFAADESSTRHNFSQAQDPKWNTMKALIERGADVNVEGSFDETALHVALKYGDQVVATYLLDNGAFYDVKTNSYFGNRLFQPTLGSGTFSEMAAIVRDVGVNALLLVTETLFQAVKNARCTEIETCLKEGAPVNSRSSKYETPLMYASWKGHINVVKVLIKNGADVNLSDSFGETPLHYAATFGHYQILYALLQHGAVYNAKTNKYNKTPLNFAQDRGNKVVVDTLELIECIFNRVSIQDKTVLKELYELMHKNYAIFLAIKNCRNENNETLTQIASKNGYEELCKWFSEL